MSLDNELKDKLNRYKIEGNIAELCSIVYSDALVAISAVELISVLSKSKTNYISVGYGDTLFKAYENGYVKGESCKLVHIYFSEGVLNFKDLYRFIQGFEEDIIFGYTNVEQINSGVKLVMIFN